MQWNVNRVEVNEKKEAKGEKLKASVGQVSECGRECFLTGRMRKLSLMRQCVHPAPFVLPFGVATTIHSGTQQTPRLLSFSHRHHVICD